MSHVLVFLNTVIVLLECPDGPIKGLRESQPLDLFLQTYELHHDKTGELHNYVKTKAQISCADSTILLLSYIQNFKLLAIFCSCTDWFVSDLVGNPIDCFSCIMAHIMLYCHQSLLRCLVFRIQNLMYCDSMLANNELALIICTVLLPN